MVMNKIPERRRKDAGTASSRRRMSKIRSKVGKKVSEAVEAAKQAKDSMQKKPLGPAQRRRNSLAMAASRALDVRTPVVCPTKRSASTACVLTRAGRQCGAHRLCGIARALHSHGRLATLVRGQTAVGRPLTWQAPRQMHRLGTAQSGRRRCCVVAAVAPCQPQEPQQPQQPQQPRIQPQLRMVEGRASV